MRVDIMTDIETLGTSSDSSVFQISACSFNIETGQILKTFNKIIDIETIPNMIVDGSTIKWWLNTNKELMHELLNSDDSEKFHHVLYDFHCWLYNQSDDMKNVYLWGNGILFDNKMIQHQFIKNDMDYPIIYKNDRDMRTIVDLACAKLGMEEKPFKNQFNDDSLVEHDALDDCKYQISIVSYCWNLLTKE